MRAACECPRGRATSRCRAPTRSYEDKLRATRAALAGVERRRNTKDAGTTARRPAPRGPRVLRFSSAGACPARSARARDGSADHLRVERDLDVVGERLAHGAVLLRRLGDRLERCGVEARR